MMKKIFALTFLLSCMLGAAWLASNKGSITINWLDYEISTSVAVLLGIMVVVFMVCAIVWSAISTLLGLPSRLRQKALLRHYRQGMEQANKALIALQNHDGKAAQRFASKAHNLLQQPEFTTLLQDQAAALLEKPKLKAITETTQEREKVKESVVAS